MTEQELQAIRAIMREELEPIKEDIAEIKEEVSEIRTSVNHLIDWAEKTGGAITFPLPNLID